MVYIMVHQKHRELIPKLHLAHQAAARWGGAIIGKTGHLRNYLSTLPAGIIVDLAFTPERSEVFKWFRSLGHRIVSYCEEASAMTNDKYKINRRFGKNTLDSVDFIALWGRWHETLVPSWIDSSKVVNSGHPRLEILQPKWQCLFQDASEEIAKKYKPFVLINTSTPPYGFENLQRHYDNEMKRIEHKRRKSGEDIPFISFKQFEHSIHKSKERLAAQIGLANNIQEKLGINVLMRPKQTVSLAEFKKQADLFGYKGKTDNRFSIVPWVQNALCVIQYGCTTSIESTLCGTPAIMYPNSNIDNAAQPTVDVSYRFETEENIFQFLSDLLNKGNPNDFDEKVRSASKWFTNVHGSPTQALLDELEERGLPVECDSIHVQAPSFFRKAALNANEKIRGDGYSIHKPTNNLRFTMKETNDVIMSLNAVYNCNIKVEFIDNNIFYLFS